MVASRTSPTVAWLSLRRSTVLAEARLRARPIALVRVGAVATSISSTSSSPPATTALATVDRDSTARINLPNAITLAGYGMTLAWIAGAPWYWAVAGILADEVDGRVARATGQATEYGGLLDWAVDITLTGLILAKLGFSWMLLVITPVQVYLRERGWRPAVGSARAGFTLYALAKGGMIALAR